MPIVHPFKTPRNSSFLGQQHRYGYSGWLLSHLDSSAIISLDLAYSYPTTASYAEQQIPLGISAGNKCSLLLQTRPAPSVTSSAIRGAI